MPKKITTIRLNAEEWDQFHSRGAPDQIFFAITTALQRASGGGTEYNSDEVPAIAHGAIVFHQAWHAFEGSYSTDNPFHGYTRDGETKYGILRNVRALREFVAALHASEWDDVLTDAIAAAEAIPAGIWNTGKDSVQAKPTDIYQYERMQPLITMDILSEAAAYVQQHCPVSR